MINPHADYCYELKQKISSPIKISLSNFEISVKKYSVVTLHFQCLSKPVGT